MCGILVHKGEGDSKYIWRRGQDHHSKMEKNGFIFEHFLLSVTGEFTPQPYVKGDIVMLFNGEIYNHPYEKSDGECIIPLYEKYGVEFAKHLDGEFAIAIYDFDKALVTFATDAFASKPLWHKGLLCASYQSGVGGVKIPANTVVQLDMIEGFLVEHSSSHDFDWEHQHKETYDDWIKAFKEAIRKRAKPECFLGLSGGYDSGAIACEVNKLGIPFKTYTIPGVENMEVVEKRLCLLKECDVLRGLDVPSLSEELKLLVEPFKYRQKVNGVVGAGQTGIHGDKASIGLLAISKEAFKEKRIVYLSGQGADEIMSDYSPFAGQSELKGHYPDNLKPWFNFYDGCQYSYLGKEEYVPGAYNIESRYPFLDKALVQEFLWLKPELKNKVYKAPLHEYLTREDFPFTPGEKKGFNL